MPVYSYATTVNALDSIQTKYKTELLRDKFNSESVSQCTRNECTFTRYEKLTYRFISVDKVLHPAAVIVTL